MTVWVVKYDESDDYTYSCEVVVGVCSTKSKADEMALWWAKKSRMLLENIDVVEQELDIPWEWEGFDL